MNYRPSFSVPHLSALPCSSLELFITNFISSFISSTSFFHFKVSLPGAFKLISEVINHKEYRYPVSPSIEWGPMIYSLPLRSPLNHTLQSLLSVLVLAQLSPLSWTGHINHICTVCHPYVWSILLLRTSSFLWLLSKFSQSNSGYTPRMQIKIYLLLLKAE